MLGVWRGDHTRQINTQIADATELLARERPPPADALATDHAGVGTVRACRAGALRTPRHAD